MPSVGSGFDRIVPKVWLNTQPIAKPSLPKSFALVAIRIPPPRRSAANLHGSRRAVQRDFAGCAGKSIV
jgi:hypothetical protein